jgi:hypothetical protein
VDPVANQQPCHLPSILLLTINYVVTPCKHTKAGAAIAASAVAADVANGPNSAAGANNMLTPPANASDANLDSLQAAANLTAATETKSKQSDQSTPRFMYIARHAERLDRAMEKEKKSWMAFAARPQDPPLSELGQQQAAALGTRLAAPSGKQSSSGDSSSSSSSNKAGSSTTSPTSPPRPTRIVTSPMVRCVMTAAKIADKLDLGPNSIWVEEGLCEEAKSMRYPRPPFLLKSGDLVSAASCGNGSNRLCLEAESEVLVVHQDDAPAARVRDLSRTPGKLRDANNDPEVHGVRRCRVLLTSALLAQYMIAVLACCEKQRVSTSITPLRWVVASISVLTFP